MSIALHAATQAIRLRRSGTSLIKMRVTLWTTTVIHLDTQKSKHDPNPTRLALLVSAYALTPALAPCLYELFQLVNNVP